MNGFNELREHSRMTSIEEEHGWAAAPEEILNALSNEGFEECIKTMGERPDSRGLVRWRGVALRHRRGTDAWGQIYAAR